MKVPRAEVDVNACPVCGARHSIREMAKRGSSMLVTLSLDPEGGRSLVIDEYDDLKVYDDTEDETYDCRDCGATWPTLEAIHDEMLTVAFLESIAAEIREAAAEVTDPQWKGQARAKTLGRLEGIERTINEALTYGGVG